MPQEKDRYGFRVGTGRSKAAIEYERGRTTAEVKSLTGSSQLNMLYVVSHLGHKVKTVKSGRSFLYKISFNWLWWTHNDMKPKKINIDDLTDLDCNYLGFSKIEVNDLLDIYRVPKYLLRAIPFGMTVRQIESNNYNKSVTFTEDILKKAVNQSYRPSYHSENVPRTKIAIRPNYAANSKCVFPWLVDPHYEEILINKVKSSGFYNNYTQI